MTKIFLQALKGVPLTPPPVWLMRQAGRYLPEYKELRTKAKNFLNFCYTPEMAVEATLQPLRRYDLDAAILFSDILVIPDALGQSVAFKEGEGPVLEPIQSVEGLRKLEIDKVLDHLAPVFQTVSTLSQEIPKSTALIGFAGAPWTVAVYMVEGRGGTDCGTARRWAYEDPEGFGQLIDILVEATSQYLNQQISEGVETIQLFDSWAGVLSESQFRRWVIDPTIKIVQNIRKENPDIPIIGFPRHAGVQYETYIRETGVDGVSLDSGVPLDWVKNNLQPLCTVQGNLDNQVLMAGGPALEAETREILEKLSDGPFIFNLGHGVLQWTSPDHVESLINQIRAER
ncbi:MAG: uroporphyrinogen decarboxylase [Rhodospirillaceae bacterium]|nr:uroporphyrinogen decarboxylase [Rhodospirillales bacterium]MBT3904689.1 uroporphyrinogen decarboxylase [Rhodospirillaceae bacterium]MBT4701395.1 uroporphyrinogen decarboxylase [Rhodospirillaceae bacterium]MBT5036223.1 uroporphyrinogen decarboxylase [Rhodospirillaceae bacterium]MBT6221643.1 uroporphyrinogen decarboxylase [Rhodospirillaceae bacterium]